MNETQSEILNLLLQNCRMTNTSIAKKIKKPQHVVSYNREQLKKQGIITGYKLILNYAGLGYKEAIIYFKIFQYSKIKNELEKFIQNHPNFKWAAEEFPHYTVRAILVYRDIDELESIMKEIAKICRGKILKKEILFENNFLKKEMFVKTDSIPEIKKVQKIKLDSKDKKLVYALFKKPDDKLIELSKKSGLSIESVRQKLSKFQKTGFIEGVSTHINKNKLGINFWGILLLRINNLDKHMSKFQSLLYSDKGYGMTRRTFGAWNVEMGLTIASYDKLTEIIKKMEKSFGADFEDFEITYHLRKFLNHKLPSTVF